MGHTSSQVTIDALVAELSSLNIPVKESRSESSLPAADDESGLAQLLPVIKATPPTITKGHLALILLAELSFDIGREFIPHLPLILQLVFLGFDDLQPAVYEHSRILLLNLIHSLVLDEDTHPQDSVSYHTALELGEFLKSKEGKPLWNTEDVTLERPNIDSANELSSLVSKVTEVLSHVRNDLSEEWANESKDDELLTAFSIDVGD